MNMTALTLAAAIALSGSATGGPEHNPLRVPDTLEEHVRLHTERGPNGSTYWLEPATGSDCSPAVRTHPVWASMLVDVTEPGVDLPIADGEGRTSIEPGLHPATLCHGDIQGPRSLVWTGGATLSDDLGNPIELTDVEFAWALPAEAAEDLIHAGQLENELAEDAELRTQPSLNAPLTGATIPAGTQITRSLAIEDLNGEMGWVALTSPAGTTGFAPHWVIDPGLGSWGGSTDPADDAEPTTEEPVEASVPEPAETETEPPHSDTGEQTANPAPTEPTEDATPPAQRSDQDGFPWPWAVGGLGLLVLGAATGTAITRRALNNNDTKEKN